MNNLDDRHKALARAARPSALTAAALLMSPLLLAQAPRETSRARPTAGLSARTTATAAVEPSSAAPAAPAPEAPAPVPSSSPASTPPALAPGAAPPSPLNPAPSEFPAPRAVGSSADLDRLLSQVAALRSRVAALTTALFSSKLNLSLQAQGDDVRIKSLQVWLDGGVVYSAPANASFERAQPVYEHVIAPGPHVVGVEIERYGSQAQQFSTWQLSKFVVVVPEKQTLWAQIELEDDSDMAEEFPSDKQGRYDLRVRLSADAGQ